MDNEADAGMAHLPAQAPKTDPDCHNGNEVSNIAGVRKTVS